MQWTIDAAHTNVDFSVKHLGIATVKGRFRQFSASAETSADGRLTGISATIDANSIDTGVEQRDNHLRSADFFDVARFPAINFVSTAITYSSPTEAAVQGDLTLHGVTRQVSFILEQEAPITDPWGNQRIASTATGKLSRKEWGLTWNQALELGGVMVSDEVKFSLEVQVIAAKAQAA
jgi:polyisoprenoid-binding protein YceI